MFYGDNEQRLDCAKQEVAARREAAAVIPLVRKVVEAFGGKVFNCRLEKALQAALEGKSTGYVIARKDNYRVMIEYQSRKHLRVSYSWLCLASYMHDTEKGKPVRIDGAKLCADLRAHYESLLHEAAEIEEQSARIDELLRNISHAEGILSAAKNAVNFTLRDIYGIRL